MNDFKNEIEHIKKQLGHNFKGAFLAGGAITSTFTNKEIRDFDIYFKTKEAFLDALAYAYDNSYWCVAATERAITFSLHNETIYQFMFFDWFETAEKIFEKFDFTCCMAAIDLDTGEFIRHDRFLADVSKRVLTFNHKTEFPLGSALRVNKYEKRGYSIEKSELLKVVLACSFRAPKDWNDLKNQIGGQYGEAVLLDTSKDFTLENAIASLEKTLIDKPLVQQNVCESYEAAYEYIFKEPLKEAA